MHNIHDLQVEHCPHRERPYEAIAAEVGLNGTRHWRVECCYRDGCGRVSTLPVRPERVLYAGMEVPLRFIDSD